MILPWMVVWAFRMKVSSRKPKSNKCFFMILGFN
jgi:hypothetical protein